MGVSAPGEREQFRIDRGFGLRRDGTPRDEVGDCQEPDWSDIVASEQTPRGQDFGRASSGFCAFSRCLPRVRIRPSVILGLRSRKLVVSAKTNERIRLRMNVASGNVRPTQRGNPMRTPKGNLRWVGVKPGKGSATNPPDGTPQGGRGESPARTGFGRGSRGSGSELRLITNTSLAEWPIRGPKGST